MGKKRKSLIHSGSFKKGHGKLYKINGMKGKKLSEETKIKISNSKKGKKQPWVKNLPQVFKKGYKKSEKAIANHRKVMIGRRLSEETKAKMRVSAGKGENSHRWIKDRSLLKKDRQKAYDTKYKYWMLEVKKRDNWKCKILNSDCQGYLEAHHILNWKDYPELRYEINNGISLCRFHHPLKRVEERRLIPFFKSMVEVK